MISVFDLLVLLVVFGGVAAVAFAVILNKESSNKPQPPQSNPYQQSAGQSWRQMPPSTKTVALLSTISDFSGAGIK